jgi:polyisoprenoid-binding protein YceI
MKSYILIPILFILFINSKHINAQNKYITRNGTVSFFSEAPLENIEAINKKVVSILDIETSELVVSIQIKDFIFKKALMQEHFNENYLESDKYPKANLKGKLSNLTKDYPLNNKESNFEGEITIHGITQPFAAKVELIKAGEIINGKSNFKIKLKDFKIKIPSLMMYNIAEEVEVKVEFNFEPYK